MVSEADERLLAYLREEVSHALRSVIRYAPGEVDPVYLRDDVRARYSGEEAADLIGGLRERPGIQRIRGTVDPESRLRCEVFVWEDHAGFHFPTGERSGVVVAVDDAAVGRIREFADGCRRFVEASPRT